MQRQSRQALLIFTRNPELGKCKTRLAATIGDRAALDIYKHLLRHTATESLGVSGADKFVYYSDRIGDDAIWPRTEFQKELQQGPSLGDRMEQAFATAFSRGYKRVVLIGSDLPDLRTADLEQAFKALEEKEVALGPASDGGYYLIGLTGPIPGLFEDKPWGTAQVLEHTLSDLSGFQVSLLEEKNDVDRYEDIQGRPELLRYINPSPDDPETTG